MKFPTRAIVTSILATILVAGQAVAGSHTPPAPTWKGYHSTISKYPPNYPYKKGNVTKTNTTTTTSTNIKAKIDASRKAINSFNTDRSFKADGSFNRTIDIDNISAKQKVKTRKDLITGDRQAASSSANLIGPKQSAYQGGVFSFNVGNGGGVSKRGGSLFDFSEDNRTVITNQTLRTNGNNNGNMSNWSMSGIDSEQAGRNNRSAEGNRIGNDQILSTGDQIASQQPNVVKNGDTSATASDTTTSSASKVTL